jgi:hypothetical protein
MATTCKLLAKEILGSTTASVTISSIPATHDDLLLIVSPRSTHVGQTGLDMRVNGDTGSNYSTRRLYGTGSAAGSDSYTTTQAYVGIMPGTDTTDVFGSAEIYIPNYAGSTNKSFSSSGCTEKNTTASFIVVAANLWSSTAAITSITLFPDNASLASGTSVYLYGIKKA